MVPSALWFGLPQEMSLTKRSVRSSPVAQLFLRSLDTDLEHKFELFRKDQRRLSEASRRRQVAPMHSQTHAAGAHPHTARGTPCSARHETSTTPTHFDSERARRVLRRRGSRGEQRRDPRPARPHRTGRVADQQPVHLARHLRPDRSGTGRARSFRGPGGHGALRTTHDVTDRTRTGRPHHRVHRPSPPRVPPS